MKDNKRIKLLIILLILLVIISILQFFIKRIENYDPIQEEIKEYGYENFGITEEIPTEEKKIEYKNLMILKEFKGSLQVTNVMEIVEKAFLEEIPKVLETTKNMSDNEVSKYYSDNKSDILNNLRIDSETNFFDMIEKFETLSANPETDYKSCEFLDDGQIYLIFTYETGEQIQCKLNGEFAHLITFEF